MFSVQAYTEDAMTKVRTLSVAVVGFFAFASMARADPPPLMTPADDDPNIRFDPDGVPLNITKKQAVRATPEEIAAYRKQRAQAAADKDWLLRAYEKQLQTHEATSSTEDQRANPYQELSSDKDLAKLAGVPSSQDGDEDGKPLPRAGDGHSEHTDAAQHSGSNSPNPISGPFGSTFLKPMITPLAAPEAAGLGDFYATLPVAGLSPFDSANPQPMPPSRVSVLPEGPTETDIETPGMIAAEKNPLTDPNTADLTLDVLPGESVDHARAHQDIYSTLQLPTLMDSDQLHRAQAAELNPPVAKKPPGTDQTGTAAAVPDKPKLPDFDAPVPINQMPVITPIRAPIAGPYDILNR
jgi:hypothetical protein